MEHINLMINLIYMMQQLFRDHQNGVWELLSAVE